MKLMNSKNPWTEQDEAEMLLDSTGLQTMLSRVSQRSGALRLLIKQLEAVQLDIEACEIQLFNCRADVDTFLGLKRVRVKFEAMASQLEFEIMALR